MVIWSYTDEGAAPIVLLLALFGLVPLVPLGLYIRNFILPAWRSTENRRILPMALLCIPIAFLLVIQALALRIPLTVLRTYGAERLTLQGSVEIVSCTEDWGRHFNGYSLVLRVGDEEFRPQDAFPWEVVERLDQGGEVKITYVQPETGGPVTIEIETIE